MEKVNDEIALRAEIERLKDALGQIANHAHNSYENTNSVDVTDGHRCAAAIARTALEGETNEQ